MTDQDWKTAKAHFDETHQAYRDLQGVVGVNVLPALQMVFSPLAQRYNNGERTQDLYDAMMSVE